MGERFFKWDLKNLNQVGKNSEIGWGRFPESGRAYFRTKVGKSGENKKGARTRIFTLGHILWHDIVQFRCPGSGTTLKQDK